MDKKSKGLDSDQTPEKPKLTRSEINRRNGKKGGRPPKILDTTPFREVPSCPDHPIKRNHWIQTILCKDAEFIIRSEKRTEAEKERSRDLRALASVIIKAGPLDYIAKAVELVSGEADELDDDTGPDEELAENVDGAMVR